MSLLSSKILYHHWIKSVSVTITSLHNATCNASGVLNDLVATIFCATCACVKVGLINANFMIIPSSKYAVLNHTPRALIFHALRRFLMINAIRNNIRNGIVYSGSTINILLRL